MEWRLKYSTAEAAYLLAKGAISPADCAEPDNALVWSAYLALHGRVTAAEILAWLQINNITDTDQRARIARLVLTLGRVAGNGIATAEA